MFDVKPIKKNDPNNPGKKIDDYWEAGQKSLLVDAKVFINSLFTFDKDNIPDRIIKSIASYMDDPNFTPAAIERSSKACTAICMWARAMYKVSNRVTYQTIYFFTSIVLNNRSKFY